MFVQSHRLLYLTLILAVLTACSPNPGSHQSGNSNHRPSFREWASGMIHAKSSVSWQSVVDSSGQPLVGAQVFLGTEPSTTWQNILTTDANGQFPAPPEWVSPETITVLAAGYVAATFLNQAPTGQEFVLRSRHTLPHPELQGQITGVPVRNKDDQADMVVVIPTLDRQDLFGFKLSTVLSSQRDKINVRGNEIFLPSNVVLPNQIEKYLLFDISLHKPIFRTFFPNLGDYLVYVTHGQFPFKKTISGFRSGKEMIDLINDLRFLRGSVASVKVGQSLTAGMNLNVNGYENDREYRLVAPAMPATDTLVMASIIGEQGVLMPTDVKTALAGQTSTLAFPSSIQRPMVLSMRKRKTEIPLGPGSDRMSAAYDDFTDGLRPQLLHLLANPKVISWREVQAPAPPAGNHFYPIGVKATLSQMTYTRNKSGSVTSEIAYPVWDVYAPTWQSAFSLPNWPGMEPKFSRTPGIYAPRWSLSFLATEATSQTPAVIPVGPELMNATTHITTTSADF